MERTDSGGRPPVRGWSPGPALAAFHDGVTVICEISAQFGDEGWLAPSPCPEWRVIDLAGHLRCVADDFHEYLDDAPASRLARLMARGSHPDTLARKLARQNAAELAALPDASGPEHIDAFAFSARAYAQRLLPIWDLPHHQYQDVLVTVGGMAGAACAEWHLHAWDLARAQGKDYRPADPDILLRGWIAGMPHLPPEGAGLPSRGHEAGRADDRPLQHRPLPHRRLRPGPARSRRGRGGGNSPRRDGRAGRARGPVARDAPRIRQDFAGRGFSRSGAVTLSGPAPAARRSRSPGARRAGRAAQARRRDVADDIRCRFRAGGLSGPGGRVRLPGRRRRDPGPGQRHRRDRRRLPGRPGQRGRRVPGQPPVGRADRRVPPGGRRPGRREPGRRHPRAEHDHPDLPARQHPRQPVGPGRRGDRVPARPRRERPALGPRRRSGPAPPCAGQKSTSRPESFPRPSTPSCCPSAPGWSPLPRPATCSAPGPTSPRSPRRHGRRARSATWTGCTRPRTARSTWPRSARTSTPPALTSGLGRMSARSSRTLRCWSPCTRTS